VSILVQGGPGAGHRSQPRYPDLNDPKPSLLTFRWLALATAVGATLALVLDLAVGAGPWRIIALVLAAITAGIVGFLAYATRHYEQHMGEAAEIAARSDAERSELQRELQRRNQLEQQLRQAKQDAESAVMAKGEFLATMSHEIRTPLNGIVPMLDLLMHNKLPADQAEMVHTAFLSSQQMLRIVDDILDYSKLEASKLQLESTTFNLRETLESVIQLMERPAQSKGLRMSLQIDPSVRLPVRGDPVRLRQVLSNLISNAVKFTERGSIAMNVRKIGETSAQHQLRFEVRDTGIGISLAAQDRLFQAFSQADTSTTRLYGGTGLGLAISKRIIDLMGGRIGVDSDAGQGSTFWFEIPLLKVQGDITPAKPAEHTTGRVLLLTGDQRLRLRLSMLLPNWGLRITSVETTQETLERIRSALSQGPTWAYTTVIADLASVRSTAVALQRNLERQTIYGQVRLICLQGDEPVPEELLPVVTLLQRQAPDADLRAALLGTAEPTPEPAAQDLGSYGASSEANGQTADATEPAAASEPTRPMRVLLVEDNPVNLMVGQRLLSVLGTHCDSATNGEAALLRMSASRYDMVLMDCQMPVMDGYTATRRWREHEAASGGRRLPIVAMTANAMAGDRQKCLDAGMDDYLAKPVTRGELERCLFHWYQISSQQTHPEPSAPVPAAGERAAETQAQAAAAPAPAAAIPPAATPTATLEAAANRPAIAANPFVTSSPTAKPGPPPAAAPAAKTEPLPPVLDGDVLEELRSILGTEVDRLIEVFLDDTPRLIAALEAAVVGPDYDMLRNASHTLKSSSANLGAMSLSNAAKKLELATRTQTLERPAVAVAVIANEFARARQALRANMSQGASQPQ
jgi:signal transduction histidine kinase/DNA-binding NarL/FixJ family response regulator/HPt (histidine-containing phosphotransfer) domain-containing protein